MINPNLIFQFINNDNEFFNEQIKKSRNYIRPIDIPNVKDKLKRDGFETVDKYLVVHNRTKARQIFATLSNTFRVSGLNPHKQYEPVEFYVETDFISTLQEKLLEFVNSPELAPKCIIHKGNKGTGKTVTQNIFLKAQHDWLEEQNIFWVRCDVHKLYDKVYINEEISNNKITEIINNRVKETNVSIKEYLDLQMLYVFLKYCNKSNLLKKIYTEISHSGLMYNSTLGHSEEKTPVKAIEIINKFKDNLLIGEANRTNTFDYSYMIEDVILNSSPKNRPRTFIRWLELSNAIQNFMLEKGYKILFIVDALDNIILHSNKTLKLYKTIISQYHNFIYEKPKNKNYIHWASVRPRTYYEFKRVNNKLIYTNQYIKPEEIFEIDHESVDKSQFAKILDKRLDYIFKKHPEEDSDIDTMIIFNLLRQTILKDKTQKTLNENFHENCRSYLLNKMNMVKFLYYRWNEDGRRSKEYSKSDELLDQAIILSNHIYFDSENFQTNIGDDNNYVFNIFYYEHTNDWDVSLNMIRWQGLCSTRILQYLILQSVPISEKVLKSLLELKFNYKMKVIENAIEALREFGMIDSELGGLNDSGDDFDILFGVSDKGRFLYNKIFSSLEILYYFCLDAYLPKFLCDDSYIDSHVLGTNTSSDYHFNCIKSSLTFVKFLSITEKIEIGIFEKTKNEILNYESFKLFLPSRIDKYNQFINNSEKYLDENQKKIILDMVESLKEK